MGENDLRPSVASKLYRGLLIPNQPDSVSSFEGAALDKTTGGCAVASLLFFSRWFRPLTATRLEGFFT